MQPSQRNLSNPASRQLQARRAAVLIVGHNMLASLTSAENNVILKAMEMKMCKVCKKTRPIQDYCPASRKTCRFCEAERRKKDYWANIERERKTQGRYRQKHQEEIRARARAYQKTERGKEVNRKACRKYRQSEHGKMILRAKSRRQGKTPNGRQKGRIRCARRRALLMTANGTFTTENWQKTITRQKNRCYHCTKKFTQNRPPTIDHIIPLSKGGEHGPLNIVASCRPCNSSKHNKIQFLL